VRLSQKTATVAENGDCLSPKTARKRRQSLNSAIVALFCDSLRFRRQIVAEIGDNVDRLLVTQGGHNTTN